MNIGYEDDDLKPFIEPESDINDPTRIGSHYTQNIGMSPSLSSASCSSHCLVPAPIIYTYCLFVYSPAGCQHGRKAGMMLAPAPPHSFHYIKKCVL